MDDKFEIVGGTTQAWDEMIAADRRRLRRAAEAWRDHLGEASLPPWARDILREDDALPAPLAPQTHTEANPETGR